MNDLSWKIKEFLRKVLPLAIIAGLVYGGYTLHKRGVFRRGPKYAITYVLRRVPYFGTRFKHYGRSESYSYRRGGKRHYGKRNRHRGRRRRH